MNLQQLIESIKENESKLNFLKIQPEEQKIIDEQRKGIFEAVLTGNGEEKCLIPDMNMVHYLFRGQNQEYVPCVPSIYRGNPSEAKIFIERMRLEVFSRLLETYPVITGFFRKNHFKIDKEGLAQHYGLRTSVLDLTSDLNIALFFAVCKYNENEDKYIPYDDGQDHEAILYLFLPIMDNEPCLSPNKCEYMNNNITPIGLQAFPRPGIQQGYALHIPKGGSVKCWMARFSFTCQDSKKYYEMYNKGNSLCSVKDILIKKARIIANQSAFSFDVFNDTFKKYRPKGYSKNKLKRELKSLVVLLNKNEDVVFSNAEINQIKDEWNNGQGAKIASCIRRKCSFQDDGIDNKKHKVLNIRNKKNFRSLDQLYNVAILEFITAVAPPEGFEWVNYTNRPRAIKTMSKYSREERIPASYEAFFGTEYLTADDWMI